MLIANCRRRASSPVQAIGVTDPNTIGVIDQQFATND